MSRFSEIAQIYDHRLPQLRSPEVWEQTLRMTSSFWRLNFCEAMLLTLQNPKAEMCGTIDQWNNIGRYIRRGEHSTAVFRSRTDTQLMYLFDVRQTYGKAYNSKWKLSERMADGIVGKFNSENAENAVSFEDYLQKSLDKNIDIVYNYNSKLNNAISNDPRTAAFIRASAEFICMTRCGIPGDSDFSDVTKINSDLSIVEIGNAATALAQAVLREIDGIIRRKEYERYEAGICGRHLRYPIRGRSERTVPPEIHELRQAQMTPLERKAVDLMNELDPTALDMVNISGLYLRIWKEIGKKAEKARNSTARSLLAKTSLSRDYSQSVSQRTEIDMAAQEAAWESLRTSVSWLAAEVRSRANMSEIQKISMSLMTKN